jgi:hypothetical protein
MQTCICPLLDSLERNWPQALCQYLQYLNSFNANAVRAWCALQCAIEEQETNALWLAEVATIVMACSGALCSANINRGSAACLMT